MSQWTRPGDDDKRPGEPRGQQTPKPKDVLRFPPRTTRQPGPWTQPEPTRSLPGSGKSPAPGAASPPEDGHGSGSTANEPPSSGSAEAESPVREDGSATEGDSPTATGEDLKAGAEAATTAPSDVDPGTDSGPRSAESGRGDTPVGGRSAGKRGEPATGRRHAASSSSALNVSGSGPSRRRATQAGSSTSGEWRAPESSADSSAERPSAGAPDTPEAVDNTDAGG
ncbi:MAG: hypothetical protein M3548_18515, partial [Actinomycetota bacterium]|nr:hypothetical protein [Actinomycetota bacterium]